MNRFCWAFCDALTQALKKTCFTTRSKKPDLVEIMLAQLQDQICIQVQPPLEDVRMIDEFLEIFKAGSYLLRLG